MSQNRYVRALAAAAATLLAGCRWGYDELTPSVEQAPNLCVAESSTELCTRSATACGPLTVTDNCGAARSVECGDCPGTDTCNAGACSCGPESDSAFCARLGSECGTLDADDNCGNARHVECGDCSGPDICNDGTCSCEPESDSAFCARLGSECGPLDADDNCSAARSADCGGCSGTETCEAGNCVCRPETDVEFCARLGGECGTLAADDRCGSARSIDCGTCSNGAVCGSANVCECPETDAEFCASHTAYCGAFTGTDSCGLTRTVASCGDCGIATCTDNACVSSCEGATSAAADWTMDPDLSTSVAQGESAIHDLFFSATPDGTRVLLNRATNVCSGQNLLLFEGTPLGGYTSRTVASGYYPEISLTHHSLWLSPDGALLIGSNAARSQLVTLPVSALFGYDSSAVDRAPAAFAAANAAAAGLGYDILGPVLSPDALAFYYTLAPTSGAVQHFEAVRASTSEPFPAGRQLTELQAGFDFVTGASDDRLTLYIEDAFRTFVTSRPHPSLPFTPLLTTAPRPTPCYRVIPLLGCSLFIGTCNSAAGCQYEDIGFGTIR